MKNHAPNASHAFLSGFRPRVDLTLLSSRTEAMVEHQQIVDATLDHVADMAPRVRPIDAAEVEAFAGITSRDALAYCVEHSARAWTWLDKGRPACMFGVGAESLIGDTGVPWLLTTVAVERNPMTFVRGSRLWVARMLCLFPHLVGYVDARHVACITWLRWLGFTIHEAEPMGKFGLPFHHFEIRSIRWEYLPQLSRR